VTNVATSTRPAPARATQMLELVEAARASAHLGSVG
jgi:hypothetical protein